VFRQAVDRADVIVATGGLGPTADDLTRQALAQAADRPLQLDADALEYIRAMFARRNRPMPPQNELQAMFPAGSRVICNPHGTAPGIDLEVPRPGRSPCRVICLPGVPAEMVEMWHGSVAMLLASSVGRRRVIRRRRIHCFGAGESQIESMLPDLIRRVPLAEPVPLRRPTVGITASKATITLRIAAEGKTEDACYAAMEPTVATIRQCLGTLVFGEEDEELQHVVVRLLRDRKKTLATAECGSAGLVAEWLAGVEHSADVYRGGLVVPDEAALPRVAWVSEAYPCGVNPSAPATGKPCLPMAPGLVAVMATRCREQFGADFGLAIGPILPLPLGEGPGVRAAGRKWSPSP